MSITIDVPIGFRTFFWVGVKMRNLERASRGSVTTEYVSCALLGLVLICPLHLAVNSLGASLQTVSAAINGGGSTSTDSNGLLGCDRNKKTFDENDKCSKNHGGHTGPG